MHEHPMAGLEGTINEFSVADVLPTNMSTAKIRCSYGRTQRAKEAIHIEEGKIVSAGPAKYSLEKCWSGRTS